VGDGRDGGVRRVNKLAAAYLLCAAFERTNGGEIMHPPLAPVNTAAIPEP